MADIELRKLKKVDKKKNKPAVPKKSFQEKKTEFIRNSAGDEVYRVGNDMGIPTLEIDKWQRKRILTSLMIFILGFVIMRLVATPAGLVVMGSSIGFYKWERSTLMKQYSSFVFYREFEFNSLMKMMIPYFKSASNQSITTVFKKCAARLEPGIIKDNLERLVIDIVNTPQSVDPYRHFAKVSSGTDDADLIMSTIYDFQASSTDVSVVEELGRQISEKMMDSIDQIIRIKLSRLNMAVIVATASPMIIMFGYLVGYVILEMKAFSEFM